MRLTAGRPSRPLALALALISGLLLSLASPPADLQPVAFVALIPLLWALAGSRPGGAAAIGMAFGVAYFGALLYWILLFGEMAWAGLTLAQAAYGALFGVVASLLWRDDRPLSSALAIASAWTAGEYFRSMWPLGGFAWGGVGYTQADNGFLLPLATVTGVWGVSFVVVLVNALVFATLAAPRRWGSARTLVALGLAAGAVLAPRTIQSPEPDGRSLDVAVVQVDVRVGEGLSRAEEDRVIAEAHVGLHETLAADPPDLVIWGENALDPAATSDSSVESEVRGSVRRVGVPTLVGAVVEGADGERRNEILALDGSGDLVDRYVKAHLVPFGEFVPWRGVLGWISALRQVPTDLTPGPAPAPLEVGDLRVGSVICFENSFPSLDRRLVAAGAEFLVVATNNASYEFTAASRQHVAMSRLRAVENGRWVVHAAISGISAFVDPQGRVVARTGLFDQTVLRSRIRTTTGETLYTRLGDWVPWLTLVVVAGLFLAAGSGRAPARRPVPLPGRPRTLVVLPTYNERETIAEVVSRLLGLPHGLDLLVVDDGSPDGTADAVRELIAGHGPRLRLVERPRKAGLASAYAIGFRTALEEAYDLIVEMDSDLSHDPDELPRLLEAAADNHLSIGSRYVRGGAVTNWSRTRLALSRSGNRYARLALRLPLTDSTSGFRVFRADLLRYVTSRPTRSEGYAFQVEMALRAWTAGFAVGEVPITFREREHGHSKISRRIVLEALWLIPFWGLKRRLGSRPAE